MFSVQNSSFVLLVVACSATQQLLLSGCTVGWPLNQSKDVLGNFGKNIRVEISIYSSLLQYGLTGLEMCNLGWLYNFHFLSFVMNLF